MSETDYKVTWITSQAENTKFCVGVTSRNFIYSLRVNMVQCGSNLWEIKLLGILPKLYALFIYKYTKMCPTYGAFSGKTLTVECLISWDPTVYGIPYLLSIRSFSWSPHAKINNFHLHRFLSLSNKPEH